MKLPFAWLQLPPEHLAVIEQGIGPLALAFMLVSMGAVTLLAGWCYYWILNTPKKPPAHTHPGESEGLPPPSGL